MSFPRYIETEWYGEGMAVLRFCRRNDENVNPYEEEAAEVGKIECYLSSLNIWEYEERASLEVDVCEDGVKNKNCLDELPLPDGSDTEEHMCPPGILPELWQSWLEHWEAWKDIYIPLSWVHKYRTFCTPAYVEWHDSYLEDYPWIVHCIIDELGSSECELDVESKTDANQKNSEDDLDEDEAIHMDIHHDSAVALNEDASEKLITPNSSQNDAEKNIVQEDSSLQNLAHTDERKKVLDALYEKHSTARYWVHLRSFLQSCGIEADDNINAFFICEAGIEFNKTRIADDTDEQKLKHGDKMILECNERQRSQDSPTGKDVKIAELSKETDEPVMIHSPPKVRNSDVSHTFDDKLQVPHQGTNGIQDVNGKNIKDHYEKSIHRKDKDHDEVTQMKNTCTLITRELTENEGKTACDSFKALGPEHFDKQAIDDSNYTVDSSKDIVSEHSDELKLDAKVLVDYQNRDDGMSQVNLDRTEKEHTETENWSDLTTSSCFKEDTRKKKKKKNKYSSHFGGLAWALKYVQSQDGQDNWNDGDRKDSVEVASASSGGLSVDTPKQTSNLLMDADPGLPENPYGSSVCDCDKPVLNDLKHDADFSEKDQTSNILGVINDNAVASEERSDLPLPVEIPKNGHNVDEGKWITGSYVTAAVKSFLTRGAFHALGLIYPLISGISQLLFQARLHLTFETVSRDSQEHSHVQDNFGKVKQTRRQEDENHVKLYKWLQSKTNAPPTASTMSLTEDTVMNGFRKYPDHRETQRLYLAVEEAVMEDGSSQLSMETMNLFDDYSQAPDGLERSLWEEVIAGYQLVNYGETDEGPPSDMPEDLHKYWFQRHRLFLKYNEGIKLDEESWYSVTPEMIALHHAHRCKCDVVVDAFCGAGGNSIQLAMTCNHVIAIDIDPSKIALAHHNAALYGVADRIDFIIGDFFQLAPMLKADVVYLSPPWGGIKYLRDGLYDVKHLSGMLNCEELMAAARTITTNIALYLPKSSDLYQIIELAGIGGTVDIEFNSMGWKRKTLTAYFGNLVYY